MPSMPHEGVLEVLRHSPRLVTKLLQKRLGLRLPPFRDIRVESADLGDLGPAEYRADLVLVLRVRGKPVLAIIVEVQLDRDTRKRRTWPVYVVNLGARLDCPVYLLVISPKDGVARWCKTPIETGHPGFVLTPLVLGPDDVPVITEPESAIQEPEMAVLSAIAHGKSEHGLAIGKAVLKAIDGLDEKRQTLYADLSFLSINEAARRALEAIVKDGYEYQSDFAKTYFGQGLKQGQEEGFEKGLEEGRRKERAQAVLTALEARGIRVPKTIRERVLACPDLEELNRWFRRAVLVDKAGEIFQEPAS